MALRCRTTFNWQAVIKISLCLTVLTYLSWVYSRNILLFFSFVSSKEHRACVYRRRNYELQEETTPLYVTLARHGRLGNWMFGYASLIGVAKANGYIPYFPAMHPLTYYFDMPHVRSEPAQCLLTVNDDFPMSYVPDMMSLPHGNISIDGYLQSWKYFRFIEEDVRRSLRMHPRLLHAAQKAFKSLVGSYVAEQKLVISVHVRRGDVLRPEARTLGFCDAPKKYFDNAMIYMAKKFPNSVFLVSSDDMKWCKENLKPVSVVTPSGSVEVPIVFSNSHTSDIDFGMLTLCNHSIMSVGTFGWWGAWLANGHVVYYNGFPLPGTKIERELKKEDYFPPHWVALSGGESGSPSFLFCMIAFLLTSVHYYMFVIN